MGSAKRLRNPNTDSVNSPRKASSSPGVNPIPASLNSSRSKLRLGCLRSASDMPRRADTSEPSISISMKSGFQPIWQSRSLREWRQPARQPCRWHLLMT